MNCAPLVFLLPLAGALEDPTAPALREEGPLRNDTFVPQNGEAAAWLSHGDRAWIRVVGEGPDAPDAENLRAQAFDAWRKALEVSATGDAVPLVDPESGETRWPDPDQTHARRSEGVTYAVLRRLATIDEAPRRAWRARFEALATGALEAAANDPARLARVERDLPLTRGAALAALKLADLALERGGSTDARAWLERSERHVDESATSIAAAVARRRAAADQLELGAGAADDAWRSATRVELLGGERLLRRRVAGLRGHPEARAGRGVEPGLAFLSKGLVVQVPGALIHVRDARAEAGWGRESFGLVLWEDLLEVDWNMPFASPANGGWPLLPATDGRDVVCVLGRAVHAPGGDRFGGGFSGPRALLASNVLVCVRVEGSRAPVVRWVLSERGLEGGDAPDLPVDAALGEGRWEFQPGPLVVGGRVYVQARSAAEADKGEAQGGDRLWLFALDLVSGRVEWSRFLTKASDLHLDLGRFSAAAQLGTPGQPLGEGAERVFVGTNAGLAQLFDAVDGRLVWAFKNRRRAFEAPGWPGSRRPVAATTPEGPCFLWAPFDSDALYALRAGPDLGNGLLRMAPPAPLAPVSTGDALDLVDGGPDGMLVLGRAGPRRALRSWSSADGWRSSLYLGTGERFAGAALASPERVAFATDRSLYLFDRERDLWLLHSEPIPDKEAGVGGDVYARGDRLYVLGGDTLWVFRTQ